MRSLTASAQTEIAKKLGTEPINIISVDWTGDGSLSWYADKDLSLSGTEIPGLILNLSDLNSVINIRNTTSSSMDVTLDDTNGIIKTIFDSRDIHKIPVVVYQFFDGLTFTDKFEVFSGQISSPARWSEAERTISFTVLSEIEDREVGFSPEESELTFVGKVAEGDAWPLCFGDVVHVPATVVASQRGVLQETLCIVDPLLIYKLESLKQAYFAQYSVVAYYNAAILGAKALAPAALEILEDYIVIIKLEDATLAVLGAEKRQMELQKRLRGGIFDAVFNALIQQHQDNIKALAIQLNVIHTLKAILERNLKLAKEEQKIIKDLIKKIKPALDALYQILNEYNDVRNEICKQQACVKSSVKVEDGALLDANGATEVIIKGTRWIGTWDEDNFLISSGPLAIYENVALAAHPGAVNDCGEADELYGLDNFRLDSSETGVSLKDMYCLVTKRGGTHKHIIKVTQQVGLDCTFELTRPSSSDGGSQGGSSSGGGMIRGYPGPVYDTPFGLIGPDLQASGLSASNAFNVCDNQISADVVAALGIASTLDLTKEEFQNIVQLECLVGIESSLAPPVFVEPDPASTFMIVGPDIESILEVASVPLPHWFDKENKIFIEEVPSEAFWSAELGTPVLQVGNECEIFVANILPSTIKAVYAYRVNQDTGLRELAQVPSSYYDKNESENIGPITITSLRFPMPLDSMGEGWEQQPYVTLDSSVGPNVVDIMKHIIDTYLPDKSYDTTTFDAVKAKFKNGSEELYPANFALFDRPNASQLLGDIAWQSRCALLEKGNTFYLTYLSEEPSSVATLTESDIVTGTMAVELTSTESIVTKLVAEWQEDYLPKDGLRKVILRHNIKKYGKQEQNFHFFIYNQRELVEKSATFWLIRLANTWKRISFNLKLNHIDLEVLDCVLLDFNTAYVASVDTKIILEQATYNSETNTIAVDAWTPIKAGALTPYLFAWPGSAAATDEFPTSEEIELEYAGGDGIGKSVTTVEGC